MRYDPYKDDQQQSFDFKIITRDAPQSREALASVEEVFADPIEPQWMQDRRRAEQEALDQGMTMSEKKSWERAAYMQVQRISEKYPSRGPRAVE